MIVPPRSCTFSPHRSYGERVEAFVWNAGCHLVVASVLNGLVLYYFEAEDLFPGVLVGTGGALAQNITHALAHMESHGRKGLKETCRLRFGGELLLGAFLTYVLSKALLQAFDYRAGKGAILHLGALSILSIAAFNRLQKS